MLVTRCARRPRRAIRPKPTGDDVVSAGLAGGGGLGDLDESSGVDVIDVAVHGDGARHERVVADAGHVLDDARRVVGDGEPVDVAGLGRSRACLLYTSDAADE